MPELEPEFGPNKYFPRPRVPITKIEYFEYVVPKKKVSPFPNVPFQFLVGEEAYQKRDKRSHSHSNTYQPIFKREQFEQIPHRPMPISILRPNNTNSSKIIPQLLYQKSSKKKKIRLVVAECIETCLQCIPNKKLYDYINIIEQSIKDGICDREQIIRDTYKRVYISFKDAFNRNIIQRFETQLSKEEIKRL